MTVANVIHQQLDRSSWIRRMFEEGIRLKAERGAENIYDFSLGNPAEDPPKGVMATFRRLAELNAPGFKLLHVVDVDYMTNYYTFKQALQATLSTSGVMTYATSISSTSNRVR